MIEDKRAKSNRSSLIGLICIVVIVLVYFLAIKTILPDLKESRLALATNAEQETKLREKLNALKTIETELNRYQELIKKVNLAMPTDESIPETITQVEALLAGSGVEVSSLQMSIAGTDGEVPVSFSVKGDLPQIYKMVNTLQENIRPFNVKLLSVTSDKDNMLNANFSLGLRYLKKGDSVAQATPKDKTSTTTEDTVE